MRISRIRGSRLTRVGSWSNRSNKLMHRASDIWTTRKLGQLLNACLGEFRQIVAAALVTGMRYGEIVGMKMADFHEGAGTVSLSTSKSGKPRLIHLTEEGRAFFAAMAAGKQRNEYVFRRADGELWGKSHQFRPMREACERAKIAPAIGFHILRHTYASRLVMRGVRCQWWPSRSAIGSYSGQALRAPCPELRGRHGSASLDAYWDCHCDKRNGDARGRIAIPHAGS